MESILKLTKDLKTAAYTLSDKEARFLVDAYYQMQDKRIVAQGQIRSITQGDNEPHDVLQWLFDQNNLLEKQVAKALDAYSGAHPVGQWARSVDGIGPVIAAGLLAHIDIKKAPTAGHIWSFCGYNDYNTPWRASSEIEAMIKKVEADGKLGPVELVHAVCPLINRKPVNILAMANSYAQEDETELKRAHVTRALKAKPFNGDLKTLCWKIGESFVKVSGKDTAYYGQLYLQRKAYEQAKNERGEYADRARANMEKFNFGKSTENYKCNSVGKLSPGHIHARCKRWAVRIFLSHLHHVWYLHEFKTLPPKPFAIEHLGHVHLLEVPKAA